MLSDNIENINSSANFLVKREKKGSASGNSICEKEVIDQVAIAGFKPLDQGN